jgi:hypothetical protein
MSPEPLVGAARSRIADAWDEGDVGHPQRLGYPDIGGESGGQAVSTVGEMLVHGQKKPATSPRISKTVWAVFCPFAPLAPEEDVPAPASHSWVPKRL